MKGGWQVGTVLHLSQSSGNLILKAKKKAKIGEVVTDSKGERIGVVFDLFGPVGDPFISVKPSIKDPNRLIGEELFLRSKRK
jgi:RNA-binding protein